MYKADFQKADILIDTMPEGDDDFKDLYSRDGTRLKARFATSWVFCQSRLSILQNDLPFEKKPAVQKSGHQPSWVGKMSGPRMSGMSFTITATIGLMKRARSKVFTEFCLSDCHNVCIKKLVQTLQKKAWTRT